MQTPVCDTKIDRVIVSGSVRTGATPPTFDGYRVVCDTFVRSQARLKTYLRVCIYHNCKTGVCIYLLYRPVLRGLPQFKLTVIANDYRALSCQEIYQIVRRFGTYWLTLIEIALDFPSESHVDLRYVRAHTLFGKSRPSNPNRFPGTLRYGGRRSDKLVRCYRKGQINRFRVELELHSSLLRKFGILRLEDLEKLPAQLYPNHIRFARLDWQALEKRFPGLGISPTLSIHKTMELLRQCAVNNPHRFLVPLRINKLILRALKQWARDCRKRL
jgi:hypothetical protein